MAAHVRCNEHWLELLEGAHGWVRIPHRHNGFGLQPLSETELLRSWVSGAWAEQSPGWECHGTGQRRPRRPLHRRQLRNACGRHGFRFR
jgi:hypothetical protein